MKKFKLLLIICAVGLLSGCKFEYNMKINDDKSADFDVVIAMPKNGSVEDDELKTTAAPTVENNTEENEETTGTNEVTGANEETTDDEELIDSTDDETIDLTEGEGLFDINKIMEQMKPNCDEIKEQLKDWTVEKYDDGSYEGCKLHKKYSSIDAVSSDKEVTVDLTGIGNGEFDDKQLFTKKGNDYSAHFTFNSKTMAASQGQQELDDFSKTMMKSFVVKYSVELPYKNLSNNATNVENDGKKLIWNLDLLNDNDIKYSFNFSGKGNIPWLYIGIGAGALVVIIILCVVLGKGKNCKCDNCSCDKKEEVKPVEPKVEEVVEKTEEVVEPKVEEVTESNNE